MNKIIILFLCLSLSGCANQQVHSVVSAKVIGEPNPCKLQKKDDENLRPLNISAKQKVGCNSDKDTHKLTPKYPPNVIKNRSLETCKSAIISTLYVPASFDRDISGTTIKIIGGNGATLKIPFTAKNGLGKKESQIAYCVTDKFGEIQILNIVSVP